MIKRTNGLIRSITSYGPICFMLLSVLMSWEISLNMPASANAAIPQEAIRLRILANSDSIEDQWIKRKIRDEIVQYSEQWAVQAQSLEEARAMIVSRMGQIEALIGETLQAYGFSYSYQLELGVVPFPAKLYGDKLYPGGYYEALRVNLGKAEGKNWWCVLFPPLCFVDSFTGEAVAEPQQLTANHSASMAVLKSVLDAGAAASVNETVPEVQKEVRFFLVDWIANSIERIKAWFA